MSAFDVVMDDPIPDKGRILTSISIFWFTQLASFVENHIISTDPAEYPESCQKYRKQLEGRSMLVKKARPLAVECIVRGYISGSGWLEYQSEGSICGIPLQEGLVESEKLPGPLFTPSTKAEKGIHDENISFERAVEVLGKETAEKVRELSLKIYEFGRELAAQKGIIIMDAYSPGGPQKSFDKQYLRDYLNSLDWPKEPPPPRLPPEVIEKTKHKYIEALERLTGHGLQ
jgi:phosphoribosylaminoimidazole-succinocarboxamide synthase